MSPSSRHLPIAKPEEIGFDAARLQRAYDLFATLTKPKADGTSDVPGGAICVGRHGKMIAPRFFGRMGPEADAAPIREDAIFLLASITKPIVYFGAMLLVERGLINLTDRVTRYLPEFAAHHKDDIRLLHLFTHTSGLPDMLANNMELRKAHAPLSKFVEHAMRDTVPMFDCGTRLSYQSMGTLLVGEIVRVVSGLPIAEFLDKELFEPLGLRSIGLGAGHVDAGSLDRGRIVRVEAPGDQDPSCGWNSRYWHDLGSPWGGMLSSPADYAVLCQLMLGNGAVRAADGREVRISSPATIGAMTRNQLLSLPDLPESIAWSKPWGLGWRRNHSASEDSYGDLLSPGTFGHHGATGTQVWMDPRTDSFCVLYTSATQARQPWILKNLSNAVAGSLV